MLNYIYVYIICFIRMTLCFFQSIYIYSAVLHDCTHIFRPAGRVHSAPFFVQLFGPPHIDAPKGPQKWSKGTKNGFQKRRQRPELFWAATRTPKGNQNRHPELTEAPNMVPRGAKMRLKGAQICPTNYFKARLYSRRLRDLFHVAQRVPKESQNGARFARSLARSL